MEMIGKNTGRNHVFRQSHSDGESIVLIHGNSMSKEIFNPLFDGPLAKKHRLIALDMPGHGDAPRASSGESYSLRYFARWLLDAVTDLRAEDAVFFGHSLGGHVLLQASSRLPHARGFMVCGTPPLKRPPNFAEGFLAHPSASYFFQENLTPEEIDLFAAACLTSGMKAPLEVLKSIARADGAMRAALPGSLIALEYDDETDAIAKMKAPFAMLLGERDELINREYLAKFPKLWRGGLQLVRGSGHVPSLEQPRELEKLIGDFVSEAFQSGL